MNATNSIKNSDASTTSTTIVETIYDSINDKVENLTHWSIEGTHESLMGSWGYRGFF